MHGTGHGVGHYLPVHEGPQSIRMEENPVVLIPGMVQSNEPAVYVQGKYGIRTENLILCKEKSENEFGTFYEFETLTFVPIDIKAIDVASLENKHVKWLNAYHKMVYDKLSPFLNEEETKWLAVKTAALD
jgi:Xaa-Pro aminopeptidase